MLLGKGATLTTYYDFRTRNSKSRYCDFVILPDVPKFVDSTEELDYDSDQLAEFGRNTISLLSNCGKKVLPQPVVLECVEKLVEQSEHHKKLLPLSLNRCKKYIEEERQFSPTFHIVGHGTPNGVGILDPRDQISPEAFAKKVFDAFRHYELNALFEKRVSFVFHTCNSAYAKVDKKLNKQQVLEKIRHESYVGRFFHAMKELGFKQVTVKGYRGYYCSVTSVKAGDALITDSFTSPTMSLLSQQGEYTVSESGCVTSCTKDDYLYFPIPLLDNPANAARADAQSADDNEQAELEKRLRKLKLQ
ncbi:MAG: hypothetical protein JSR17_08185 [Proteobacteria bacterium]|nr:hypothetical protein [Pseudomonadota bacterium]